MSKLSKWWARITTCPLRKSKNKNMSEKHERELGEMFQYKNVTLKVCNSNVKDPCSGCYFGNGNMSSCIERDHNITGPCFKLVRKDDKDTIFKEIKKEKTMKKSDLKLGNIVECRNGATYILVKTEVCEKVFIGLDGFMQYDNYNENMLDTARIFDFIDKDFDIMKVYKGDTSYGAGFKGILKNKGHLLWERQEEITELTLEDVAKKFNVNVKNLRIKD